MPAKKPRFPVAHFSLREQRIYDFLKANPIGVLSSITPEGTPHGSVIYYSVDEQFLICFLTKSETKKAENLRHNPQVMLTLYEARSHGTAQIIGKATEITDPTVIKEVAARSLKASIKTAGTGRSPLDSLQAGEHIAYRITPSQIRLALFGKQRSKTSYEQIFDSLESFELEFPQT